MSQIFDILASGTRESPTKIHQPPLWGRPGCEIELLGCPPLCSLPPRAPNLTQMKRKAAIGCIFVVCLSACFGCLRWPLGPTTKTFHDLPGTRAGHGGTPLRPPSRRREPRAGGTGGRFQPYPARDSTRRHGTGETRDGTGLRRLARRDTDTR